MNKYIIASNYVNGNMSVVKEYLEKCSKYELLQLIQIFPEYGISLKQAIASLKNLVP